MSFFLGQNIAPRQWAQMMLLVTLIMLVVSVYLQQVMGLLPCMICELQRYLLVPLALVFAMQCWMQPCSSSRRTVQFLALVLILMELCLSARHLSLLYFSSPDAGMQACLPGLVTYAHNASWLQAISVALQGSGEGCRQITWRFLMLSLPEWTAMAMMGLLALWCLERRAMRLSDA